MRATPFERIHDLHPRFNRIFSGPLYVAGLLVVLLLFVLPYSGRIAVAFLINVFFNRPLVYLNYVGRLVARPLHFVSTALVYYLFVGVYSLGYRAAGALRRSDRNAATTWVAAPPATDKESAWYQS